MSNTLSKLDVIVFFSKAGQDLTIQEKMNYCKNNSYSDNFTTVDMLRDFRLAAHSLIFYPDSENAELFSNTKWH